MDVEFTTTAEKWLESNSCNVTVTLKRVGSNIFLTDNGGVEVKASEDMITVEMCFDETELRFIPKAPVPRVRHYTVRERHTLTPIKEMFEALSSKKK